MAENDGNALVQASIQNDVRLVERLLKLQVDANSRGDGGATVLLLRYGADVDAGDEEGRTALHWCAQTNHKSFAQFILQNHGSVDIGDSSKRTPLHYAAHSGFLDIVKLLLRYGANPCNLDGEGTDDVSPADILPGGSTRQGEDIDEEVIHEQENNNRYVYVKPSEAGCGVGTAVANNVIVEEDEDEFLEIDNGNDKANRSNVVETRPIECGISPNATPRGVCKNMSVSLPVSVVASVDTSGPPSQNTSNSALHSASKDTSMSSSGQQNVLPIFSESRDFESKNVLVATPKQTSSSVRSSPSAEICVTSPRPHSDVGVHTPPHSAALLISQESSSGARSLGSLDQQDNPVLFSEEFEHEIDRRLTARLELERAKWERQAIVVFIKYEANKPLPIVCVPPLSWHKLRDRCCSVVSLVSDHCTSLDVDGIVISDDVGCDSVKWVSGMTITVRTPSVSGSISATASATASSSDVTKVGSESHTKIEPVRKSGGALPKPVTASSNSLKSPAGRPRAGSTGSPNITAKPQRSSSPIAGRANSGLLSPATAQTPSLKTYAAPSSKTPERGSLSLSGEPHKRTMSTPIKAPVKAVPEKKPSSTVSKK